MRGTRGKWISLFIGAALFTATTVQASELAPDGGSVQVGRWLGAEGGFDEIACWGSGFGCPGFSSGWSLDGAVSTRPTMRPFRDPDGVSRLWSSRTGMRLFLAAVYDTTGQDRQTVAGSAMLSTFGSHDGHGWPRLCIRTKENSPWWANMEHQGEQ